MWNDSTHRSPLLKACPWICACLALAVSAATADSSGTSGSSTAGSSTAGSATSAATIEVSTAAAPSHEAHLDYPPARRAVVVEKLHGVEVSDPYRWMEDTQTPDVLAWAKAQDALVGTLFDESVAYRRHAQLLGELTDLERWGSSAVERDGRLFVSRTEGVGINGLTYLVRDGDGPLRTLVDSRKLFADGERRVSSSRTVSPDGRLFAYGTARTGSRWITLQLITVGSPSEPGKNLESLRGLNTAMTSFGWVPDDRSPVGWGFYYARLPQPPNGREMQAKPEGARLFYHRVGTDQTADRLVYDPKDPQAYLLPTVTDDFRFLVVRVGRAGDSAYGYQVLDLRAETDAWQRLAAVEDGYLTFEQSVGGRFIFRTDRNAPRGRVVAVELGGSDWQELIPEHPRAVLQNVDLVADRLIVLRMNVSLPDVQIYDLKGRLQRRVELPVIGMPWTGFSGRPTDPHAYFGLSTVVDPGSIYRLNPRTGSIETVLRSETPVDPRSIVIRRVEYPGHDGTEVPMFLAHRKDLDLDKPQPVFMYGYGAYAWVAFPWFQPHVVSWMASGGIYALPGIRGGGEHGETWHASGKGRHKKRAIQDFVDAGAWLVKQKITTPSKLVANGGSASGVVAAAAVQRRPDLFAAAVIDIPSLDMVRYQKAPRGTYWETEFGRVEDAEDFAALHAYSPYHALQEDQCLPSTLLTVGERDEITPPWHGYKFAARAQAKAAKIADCHNEILLQVVWGEGHGFGTTSEQSVRTWARQLAFLDHALDLGEAEASGTEGTNP